MIHTPVKKKRQKRRELYSSRLKSGRCPMCGKPRTGEWITCEACLEINRLSSSKISRQSKTLAINRYRDKCRKKGICYGCGREIGLGKYKKCAVCRERDRVAKARRYAEATW